MSQFCLCTPPPYSSPPHHHACHLLSQDDPCSLATNRKEKDMEGEIGGGASYPRFLAARESGNVHVLAGHLVPETQSGFC